MVFLQINFHKRVYQAWWNFLGTNLRHDAIRSGDVPEDDLSIVVIDEVFESAVVPADPTLWQAAGREGVLRHVGDVLLEDQGVDSSGPSRPRRSPTRSAGPATHHQGQEEGYGGNAPPHLLESSLISHSTIRAH